MTVAIQSAEDPEGQVLVVHLGITRPDNALDAHQTGLTPSHIRTIIAGALEGGWRPESPGSTFRYRYPLIRDTIGRP